MLSRGRLFATPRTVALQVPLSVGFSRREDWGGLPFPPPGDRPHPGTEPTCPTLRADCLFNIFFTTEPLYYCIIHSSIPAAQAYSSLFLTGNTRKERTCYIWSTLGKRGLCAIGRLHRPPLRLFRSVSQNPLIVK